MAHPETISLILLRSESFTAFNMWTSPGFHNLVQYNTTDTLYQYQMTPSEIITSTTHKVNVVECQGDVLNWSATHGDNSEKINTCDVEVSMQTQWNVRRRHAVPCITSRQTQQQANFAYMFPNFACLDLSVYNGIAVVPRRWFNINSSYHFMKWA